MATHIERVDALLSAHGYTYDPEMEQFMLGCMGAIDPQEIIGLDESLTLDDIASFQDAKYDELRRTARPGQGSG